MKRDEIAAGENIRRRGPKTIKEPRRRVDNMSKEELLRIMYRREKGLIFYASCLEVDHQREWGGRPIHDL